MHLLDFEAKVYVRTQAHRFLTTMNSLNFEMKVLMQILIR